MKNTETPLYFYITDTLQDVAEWRSALLPQLTERHPIEMGEILPSSVRDIFSAGEIARAHGLVIKMHGGVLGRYLQGVIRKAFSVGYEVFLHWPRENTVERITPLDLPNYRMLWVANFIFGQGNFVRQHLKKMARNLSTAFKMRHFLWVVAIFLRQTKALIIGGKQQVAAVCSAIVAEISRNDQLEKIGQELSTIIRNAAPVPCADSTSMPSEESPLKGGGVYLRTDFWAKISSGGSYGHTCYVAKELARVSEQLMCVMAHDYSLLKAMGVRQVVMPPPGEFGDEPTILLGTETYTPFVKMIMEWMRPAYIYERVCLGNYVGAKLSQELHIPYIVEYNGSEISMRRSFDGQGYQFENIYLLAEEAAFRQATAISVVSKHIKTDLIKRGIDADKVFVNPNGVDTSVYQPFDPERKNAVRAELGWDNTHIVVGFTGTFGGWHGIDILAESLPLICNAEDRIRFLLIGDGNYKHLVDDQIQKHHLQEKVRCVGRIPQMEGVRMLGACDIYASPHNSHMIDSSFFGSPTKIFEYMAMGGGIVASDLEQIGEVLSPGLCATDLSDCKATDINDQRSVLCEPGDVGQFAAAVLFLAKNPEICAALGRNARKAAVEIYSWEEHVKRIWKFLYHGERFVEHEDEKCARQMEKKRQIEKVRECPLNKLESGDRFKDEAQNQWNNDPCGSHYVKESALHTLDWYLEVERYRYDKYGPWMPEVMEFNQHSGEQVLEIGSGIGTDLSQFAINGAIVTDVDLAAGHLALAEENFRLRGLNGRFIQHDAENLPFEDNSFDVVYSNGVIHHIPNTKRVVEEIYRVLKPGGKAIVMVYALNSRHYWQKLVIDEGLKKNLLEESSMGEIMSSTVEISKKGAKPLVKVYTGKKLRTLFNDAGFRGLDICKCQLTPEERPFLLRWMPLGLAGKLMGWNLVIKGLKPLQ
ncbi:MAG: methyltransferase domain-containing protein [Desulfobulbaceae bacterium]|nr:methyltransferase domain-containing protein [Desulfobulbaceae bacterium]